MKAELKLQNRLKEARCEKSFPSRSWRSWSAFP